MDLEEALAELKKLSLSSEKIKEIVDKSRNELEGIIFDDKEYNS